MSSASALVLSERDESAVLRKTVVPQPAQIPQSVFTKAMLDEMLDAKNREKEEAKQVEVSGENDAVVPGSEIISTAVVYRAPSVSAPNLLGIAGIKVDLKAQTDRYKEEYMKNFAMSKSHNILVSKFAAMKYGFYGMMLSFLGVAAEEIQHLQKTARDSLIAQNRVLFEENEYAGEMLEIMGGSKKKLKAERKIIDEMRKQLLSQFSNCGLKDEYTPEKILEIQKKECLSIAQKLREEKTAVEYELSMMEAGLSVFEGESDARMKIDKINKLLTKAETRLEFYDKKSAALEKKTARPDPFHVDDKVRLSRRGRKR